jgi:hypothetical protein
MGKIKAEDVCLGVNGDVLCEEEKYNYFFGGGFRFQTTIGFITTGPAVSAGKVFVQATMSLELFGMEAAYKTVQRDHITR